MMHIAAFDYPLPGELIAQKPVTPRDHARMLVVDRQTAGLRDRFFYHLPCELESGSVVVVNNTRVFPARLFGRRKGFVGRIEVLLLSRRTATVWEALVKPARRIRPGAELIFGDGLLEARVRDTLAEGRRIIEFQCEEAEVDALIDRIGVPPLPPYIKRTAADARQDADTYQTIFAKHRGAVAAPTAGLHFTDAVCAALEQRGIRIVELTLHVGYGTFKPITDELIERHQMEAEYYTIPETTAEIVNQARRERRPIIAVGTTTVRTLESAANEDGWITAGSGWTQLFIYPGYRFKVIGGLLTNFHLPRSTSLLLVCALAGRETVLRAYHHAIAARYRFYSFGDCMLIRP
jgi:S-adenosylmethionine:tRNA ribosyltransferase-isomerase